MRRALVAFTAFVALTGTVLVLPVYAAPAPDAQPVAPTIDTLALGSVTAPAPEAVVTDDGDVVAAGARADVPVGHPVDPQDTPSAPAPAAGSGGDTVAATGDEIDGVPALTVSEPHTDEFSAVGVTWAHDPRVTDVAVKVRVADPSGSWSDWTTLQMEDDAGGPSAAATGRTLRDGTAPYFSGPSTGVEVVLQAPHGALPRDVRTQLIDPGTSPADAAAAAAPGTDQAHAATGRPTIYSRAQWGADEKLRTWGPQFAATIKAATIHHTDTTDDYSPADVPGIIRSIYAFHAISRGWGDIGYNVVVDKFGRAWEGRYSGSRGVASPVIGAHAGGFNTSTFGVAMLGDFSTVTPPAALRSTVAALIAWKFALYHVNPVGSVVLTSGGGGTDKYAPGVRVRLPAIFAHRDVGNTTCPGDAGYAAMPAIRAAVVARMPGWSTPKGHLDAVVPGHGSVSASGWAVDWDQPTTDERVRVYLDGRRAATWTTHVRRPGVRHAYPTAGSTPGFLGALAVRAGVHRLCFTAVSIGRGANGPLGCRTVQVAAPRPVPRGHLDAVTPFGSQVLVQGWAYDEDRFTRSLTVSVTVDGRHAWTGRAAVSRPDVARVHPVAGPAHGFSQVLSLHSGAHRVCVTALNAGAGRTNPSLGCRTVRTGIAASAPVGKLTAATVSGRTARLAGWVVDPQAPTTGSPVRLYVDGGLRQTVTADQPTKGPAALRPFGVGSGHGFATSLTVNAGRHQVCARGVNVGAGSRNTGLGCATVTVAPSAWNPIGRLDRATVKGRVLSVSGWALDYDAPSSAVTVRVSVDGGRPTAVLADADRPDVARAYPGTGGSHGYATAVSLGVGTHRVCVAASNVGQGSANPALGCRTVSVAAAAFNPVGRLDPMTVSDGTLAVRGWAFDPDVPTAPITVTVSVDGQVTVLTADASRPDVGRAYPGVGDDHGYEMTATVAAGTHTVCASGTNVGTGTANPTLGCRQIVT